jgi:hypothetical protein
MCWLNGNNHDTNRNHVNDALEEKLRINQCEVRWLLTSKIVRSG